MTLAVACASGGFKGVFVHGVLSAFERAGFHVDGYAASSASVASASFAVVGRAREIGVERLSRFQIVPEWLFHNDALPMRASFFAV